jgi:hypothetical protein
MRSKFKHNVIFLYGIIVFIALLPRIYFILFSSTGGGDWDIYSTVAENILSGCGVSLSVPGGTECNPHFGGNQGPGYPAFVALVWYLSEHSDMAVRFLQMTFGVLSIVYMVRSIHLYTASYKAAILVGLVLSLSPLEVAWSRYLQTETLALAGTLWIFSELINSLYESRLRVMHISFALILTTFIRLDAVLLTIPIAVVAFLIYKPIIAIKKGMIIAVILSLPWGLWLVRNSLVGMENILPQPMVLPNNAPAPTGYLKWVSTWTTEEYQRPGSQFPVTRFMYDKIQIDEKAYESKEERKKVEILLNELKKYTGKAFPIHIDRQFLDIANERVHNNLVSYLILNPLLRIKSLWSNIYNSFGWPTELPSKVTHAERLEIARGGLESKIDMALRYPSIALGKAVVNVWRLALYIVFIFSVYMLLISSHKYAFDKKYKHLLYMIVSFIIARSVFSGMGNYIETRYTLAVMPLLEILSTIVILRYTLYVKNNNSIAKHND